MCGRIVFVQCSSEISFVEAIFEGDSSSNSSNLELCLFVFVSGVVVLFVEFRECNDLQLEVLCEETLDSSESDSGVTWVKFAVACLSFLEDVVVVTDKKWPCVNSAPNKSLQCSKKHLKQEGTIYKKGYQNMKTVTKM